MNSEWPYYFSKEIILLDIILQGYYLYMDYMQLKSGYCLKSNTHKGQFFSVIMLDQHVNNKEAQQLIYGRGELSGSIKPTAILVLLSLSLVLC